MNTIPIQATNTPARQAARGGQNTQARGEVRVILLPIPTHTVSINTILRQYLKRSQAQWREFLLRNREADVPGCTKITFDSSSSSDDDELVV